jgi:hypothetical protein
MRAEERQPEDGEVREMTDDRPEMPGHLWMHVWGRPLRDLGGADRSRSLPLQPLPAAIGQRLLDHHHQTLDKRDRRRNRRLRRYRFQRLPCCAPTLPACGSPLTTESDAALDIMVVKAGGIDANEWFHPVMELFVGRRRPWVAPVPGAVQLEGNPP